MAAEGEVFMKDPDVLIRRKTLLEGLRKLEAVHGYLADCRLEAESRVHHDVRNEDIPSARQEIMKEMIDGWKLEKELEEAILSICEGLKGVCPEWQPARLAVWTGIIPVSEDCHR